MRFISHMSDNSPDFTNNTPFGILPTFCPDGPIKDHLPLLQVLAWHRTGEWWPSLLMLTIVTRVKCVNKKVHKSKSSDLMSMTTLCHRLYNSIVLVVVFILWGHLYDNTCADRPELHARFIYIFHIWMYTYIMSPEMIWSYLKLDPFWRQAMIRKFPPLYP